MAHLHREELIALAESTLSLPEGHHAAVCDRCRRELESARALLAAVRDVDVPEPSPLFWEHLATRVRDAVAQEPSPRVSWLHRFTRPAWAFGLGASAAAAMLAAALIVRPFIPPAPTETAAVVPTASGDSTALLVTDVPAGEDWELITDVADSVDLDEVREIGGGVSPGVADAALMELSADERGELARIIREELGKERSS